MNARASNDSFASGRHAGRWLPGGGGEWRILLADDSPLDCIAVRRTFDVLHEILYATPDASVFDAEALSRAAATAAGPPPAGAAPLRATAVNPSRIDASCASR